MKKRKKVIFWFGITGVLLLCLPFLIALLVADSELRIRPEFDRYLPEAELGIKKIIVQRNRYIRYFGYKRDHLMHDAIDFAELRRKKKTKLALDATNIIKLEIENGKIKSYDHWGTSKEPDVNAYILDSINDWRRTQDERGAVFSEFVDKLTVIMKLKHNGQAYITYEDIDVEQPTDKYDAYRFFNTVELAGSPWAFPLKNFRKISVSPSKQALPEFHHLRLALGEWEEMRLN